MSFPICRPSTSLPNLDEAGPRVEPRVACSLSHPYRDPGILPPNPSATLATPHPGARMQQQGNGRRLSWPRHKVEKSKEGHKALQGAQIECLISGRSPTVTPLEPTSHTPAHLRAPTSCVHSAHSKASVRKSLLVLNCVWDAKATILTGAVMS